jgi:hypothetical protein
MSTKKQAELLPTPPELIEAREREAAAQRALKRFDEERDELESKNARDEQLIRDARAHYDQQVRLAEQARAEGRFVPTPAYDGEYTARLRREITERTARLANESAVPARRALQSKLQDAMQARSEAEAHYANTSAVVEFRDQLVAFAQRTKPSGPSTLCRGITVQRDRVNRVTLTIDLDDVGEVT